MNSPSIFMSLILFSFGSHFDFLFFNFFSFWFSNRILRCFQQLEVQKAGEIARCGWAVLRTTKHFTKDTFFKGRIVINIFFIVIIHKDDTLMWTPHIEEYKQEGTIYKEYIHKRIFSLNTFLKQYIHEENIFIRMLLNFLCACSLLLLLEMGTELEGDGGNWGTDKEED